jgi:hypothetical protein
MKLFTIIYGNIYYLVFTEELEEVPGRSSTGSPH